jgi:hypothetical protein
MTHGIRPFVEINVVQAVDPDLVSCLGGLERARK